MPTPVIMDAVAVGAVVLLAALGAWRGLWKTLAGIAAFVAALVLAGLLSSALTGPVTDRAVVYVMDHLDSYIQNLIESQSQEIQEQIREQLEEQSGQIREQAGEQMAGLTGTPAGETVSGLKDALSELVPGFDAGSDTISLDQVPDLLNMLGLSAQQRDELLDRIRQRLSGLGQSTAASARVALEEVVRQLVEPIVHAVLYVVSFLLLSLVLKIALGFLGKALGAIPGMKTLNRAGGLALGLLEGLLLLTAVSWILRTVGFTAEAPPLSDTVVLRFLAVYSPLNLLSAGRTQV